MFIILGTLAKVSTLLSTVGLPNKPCSTVLGGLTLGIPLLPSIEAVSAEPSPQTKAPAPLFIWKSKLNPLPNIFSPIRPYSLACFIAFSSLFTAIGYSALT